MTKWSLGLSLVWALACAGPSAQEAPAPVAPSERPWSAFEGDWENAAIVDGKPVFFETCGGGYTLVQGDHVLTGGWNGEGIEYPILGSHQDGDWLVLETKDDGPFRIKRDGPAIVWDKPVGKLLYPKGTALPRLRECCFDLVVDMGSPEPTGEIVSAGQRCKVGE